MSRKRWMLDACNLRQSMQNNRYLFVFNTFCFLKSYLLQKKSYSEKWNLN